MKLITTKAEAWQKIKEVAEANKISPETLLGVAHRLAGEKPGGKATIFLYNGESRSFTAEQVEEIVELLADWQRVII